VQPPNGVATEWCMLENHKNMTERYILIRKSKPKSLMIQKKKVKAERLKDAEEESQSQEAQQYRS